MRRRLAIAILVLVATAAHGADVGITARRLLVIDRLAAGGTARISFVAKDPGVTKGSGTSPAAISARLDVAYDATAGQLVIPAGAYDGTAGWKRNDATQAQYRNRQAPAGPTQTKDASIKPGLALRLSAKGLGDTPIDILGAGAPTGDVLVAYAVTNGAETTRHCTRFSACSYRLVAGNAGARLRCENGTPDPTCANAATALDRPADPVVLTGADVPTLTGIAPGDLVAFRYAGGWQQVPVQVDERKVVNFDDVYNGNTTHGGGFTRLDYADAATYTGADPDATLDGDDEIVFMARDAGAAAGAAAEPAGVVAGSGRQVTVADPLGPGVDYVYLFRQAGSLDPAAGQQYVAYTYSLDSGTYLATWNPEGPPNARNDEDSTAATAYYARHFTDRWNDDELRILAAPATGVDLLERHKTRFGPALCVASEVELVANMGAEGAFVANKSGPVRGIRTYAGALSGPLTQRQHYFYERREDITGFVRVHALGDGGLDVFDYDAGALGMTYRNSLNPAGVTVDGVPDALVTTATPAWEQLEGPQGTLTIVPTLTTDIPVTNAIAYYLDDATPTDFQCPGVDDPFAYGISGSWLNQPLPNTDPRTPPANQLETMRSLYYDPPGLGAAEAGEREAWTRNPVVTAVSAWP